MEQFSLGKINMYVSDDHRFGTDAFLLGKYAEPHRGNTVCDLCTGCGIIPLIFCKKEPPKKIYAVEIQEEAVGLLNASIKENSLEGIIEPVLCDLRELPADKIPRESVDIVTANPPYMTSGSGYEKLSRAQAVARHELLCSIDDVCKTASSLLKYGGLLKMCHRPERLADVICAMRTANIEPKSITFVQNIPNERPWLFLISGKKGANAGMNVEKPVILRNADGSYTEDYLGLYE